MEDILGSNIKTLRRRKGLTQDQLADKIGVNRAMIGSYEEGRATPKLSALSTMAHYFNVTLDELVNTDISTLSSDVATKTDATGKNLRVLTTLVDRDNNELITLVPVKASAGYLNGYADPDFIDSLPRFSVPVPELSRERTYRAFQIKGDSMVPIPTGSYILCEYLLNWNEMKEGQCYVLLTRDEGLVYKRFYKSTNDQLLLKSDNPEYAPFEVPFETVSEVWKALGYLTFTLPDIQDMNLNKLTQMMFELKNELNQLKSKK